MVLLTGFQLRAAKKVLNQTLDQFSCNTKVSKVTLSRLINSIGNEEEIRCSAQDAQRLSSYLNSNNLIFPDKYTIELKEPIEKKPVNTNLTRFQFIVARTAMRLSQKKLAQVTDLTHASFQRFEEQPNTSYIRSAETNILNYLAFFYKAGISFPTNLSVSLKNNNS